MYFHLAILLMSLFLSSSNQNVLVVDKTDHTPIAGVEILSDEGSVLLNTDLNGMFNKSRLKEIGIKHVILYSPEHKLIDFKTENLPDTIFLEKREPIELEGVTIVKSAKKEKYFTVRGYARSWKLTNNKLSRYGDAIIEYHIPYEKSNNDFATGIKNYITEYRTFKIDNIKQKSRVISISAYDGFFDCRIPIRDILERTKSYKNYTLENIKDSLYNIIEDKSIVGIAVLADNKYPAKINLVEEFRSDEVKKNIFWKFSVGEKNTEVWTGEGEERHPLYLFYNKKFIVNTKLGSASIEVVNEIFIEDIVINGNTIPDKSVRHIDIDRSYYSNNKNLELKLLEHPLPSNIEQQIRTTTENKNKFK